MDRLAKYRKIIKQILEKHASFSDDKVEDIFICDEQKDVYVLASIGWHPSNKRQYGFPICVRIKNAKLFIEWDGTEYGVANELMDNGIPPEDIVLGFQQPQPHLEKELIAA